MLDLAANLKKGLSFIVLLFGGACSCVVRFLGRYFVPPALLALGSVVLVIVDST